MANDRIYVPASDEVITKIIRAAKKEKRSMAKMAESLLEKGLELYETGINIVPCKHDWHNFEGIPGVRYCIHCNEQRQ